MSTAMSEAFRAANYVPPREAAYQAVLAAAVEAWRKWSKVDAGGARRDYVRAYLADDATWILLERCQPQALTLAVTWILDEAARQIESQRPERDTGPRPVNGGGQRNTDNPASHVPAGPNSDAGKPAGAGQRCDDTHASPARAPTDPDPPQAGRGSEPATMPATPSQSAPAAPLADRHAARAEAVVAIHARLSRLDTVRIDGTPVGDCTVQQVRDWAERRRFDQRTAARDVRFALSLIGANLNRNEIIRRWIKPDEADELYRRAEEVANAA